MKFFSIGALQRPSPGFALRRRGGGRAEETSFTRRLEQYHRFPRSYPQTSAGLDKAQNNAIVVFLTPMYTRPIVQPLTGICTAASILRSRRFTLSCANNDGNVLYTVIFSREGHQYRDERCDLLEK